MKLSVNKIIASLEENRIVRETSALICRSKWKEEIKIKHKEYFLQFPRDANNYTKDWKGTMVKVYGSMMFMNNIKAIMCCF